MISAVCRVLVAVAVCSGCLRKEVTQTVYLGPSGVVWSVIERDVRRPRRSLRAGSGRSRTTSSPPALKGTAWRRRFAAWARRR
jgi:hypothetical protein